MADSRANTNGIIGEDPTGSFEQEATSSLDPMGKEGMSTEWTDEKHNLFLNSMEASFVDQLYNSMDLLGWRRRKEHHSARFKVHQHGSWWRTNFKRAEPPGEEADGCHHMLLANTWIRHFRARCRQDVPFATNENNIASISRLVNCEGEKELACGSANYLKQFTACSQHEDQLNSNEEVSDQNFVEEDDGEINDDIHRTKRLKPAESTASSND
ncbi:hypothetical protein Nepgr_025077 [Nepenthes gracilis]|uniref:Uncharacterized protein n=1 Tax=Nepenthes gracilis TaxID=150966 RepID=A0AAD3Y0M8_NEPGR|nr:hypothetical protein Nepgr_025077 [Nepenthes gracilis]